jgi:hypothetical protein
MWLETTKRDPALIESSNLIIQFSINIKWWSWSHSGVVLGKVLTIRLFLGDQAQARNLMQLINKFKRLYKFWVTRWNLHQFFPRYSKQTRLILSDQEAVPRFSDSSKIIESAAKTKILNQIVLGPKYA